MKVSSSICLSCMLVVIYFAGNLVAQDTQTRVSSSEAELRRWLENMAGITTIATRKWAK